ncbi:hypothetical protein [Cellulomonas sp. ATA003]|uniref:hypothetical protein n=1 Tax=Cellulomonas sp. ATA003 TaxID=3073064 RepID=UPI002873C4F1|nr:hypothetical protein [Cellulomonas sp. ATA003]WNB85529.1 hypothetical protein REH70_18570 [Cellulomonas sp. ATA003]
MTSQPAQTFLSRAVEDGRYDWTRSVRVRRRLVLAEVGLLTALLIGAVVASTTDDGWTAPYLVAWVVGMFGFIPLHSLLNTGIRCVFDRSPRSLDEHQRRLREQSTAAIQWPGAVLTALALVGAVGLAELTGHTTLGLGVGFLLWFAATLLAYWHLAWTLPDEDDGFDLDA